MKTIVGHWFVVFLTRCFFEYLQNAVTIYCVFHTARDPQKWRETFEVSARGN